MINIINKIENQFLNLDEIPLFYVESGSRLWNIASPDSDYDVRGFHLKSKRKYFDFKNHKDIIESMLGDFDFVSYDIDKMFRLLAKSNPTVFEWIRSHIIYFNKLPDWTDVKKEIITNFDFKALYHHYISLSNSHFNLLLKGKKFTYKTLFYIIRALLSAKLSSNQILPELLIEDLFNQFEETNDIILVARNSLDKKKQQKEKEQIAEEDKEKIISLIKNYTNALENKVPETSKRKQKLTQILTDYRYSLKCDFYC